MKINIEKQYISSFVRMSHVFLSFIVWSDCLFAAIHQHSEKKTCWGPLVWCSMAVVGGCLFGFSRVVPNDWEWLQCLRCGEQGEKPNHILLSKTSNVHWTDPLSACYIKISANIAVITFPSNCIINLLWFHFERSKLFFEMTILVYVYLYAAIIQLAYFYYIWES